ncbi:MAG: DUF4493 domain-containing protein [Muribaculaceae bacterium]
MKNNILTTAAIVAAMMATSCDGNWTPPVGDEGKLDLSSVQIINDDAEKLVKNEQSRADEPDASYIIEVYKTGETTPVNSWTYGTMPEIVALEKGDYRIEVESHKVAKAEWEKPYFKGSQTFSIKPNQITQVEAVTCHFSSIKVTITVEDDLKALLSDDATFTVIANDEGELVYGKNETRAGYFEAVDGSNTMIVKFKGTLGNSVVEENFPFTDIEAGQYRDIVFKTKNGPQPPQPSGDVNVGGIDIDASYTDRDIDGNVTYEEEVIDGERPGKEDPKEDPDDPNKPDDPNPPVTDPIKFTSSTLKLEKVNEAGDSKFNGAPGSAVVDIHSDKGLAHLYVKIDSKILDKTALNDIGLNDEFDLAAPGEYQQGVNYLHFPSGSDVVGKNDVKFDISIFVPMLNDLGTGDDTIANHSFIVTAVDSEGNEKEFSLKFVVR